MRKTKIVCTMGPSTDKPGILRQLMENGMNVARFNFSHGDYEEHKGRYDKLRTLSQELDLPIAAIDVYKRQQYIGRISVMPGKFVLCSFGGMACICEP